MPEQTMDDKLKTFYELYDRRQSVRVFSERGVEPEKLDRLIEILRRAQSAANRQPWHFIIIEKEGRDALDVTFTKEGFKTAPIIIAALAEPEIAWIREPDNKNYAWVDVTIAVTEMIGAATAEGLGACWIAAIDPEEVRRLLQIPAEIEIVALIALGYPEEELKRIEKDRKTKEEIIHYDKW